MVKSVSTLTKFLTKAEILVYLCFASVFPTYGTLLLYSITFD